MKPNILLLTCKDNKEANKIIKTLLLKKLIACAKKIPVDSNFLWKGKIDSNQEVLVLMESFESKFKVIEKEVKKLHSYDTFVLLSIPVSSINKKAKKWLKTSIKKNELNQ